MFVVRQGDWNERFRIHVEDAAVQHQRLARLIDCFAVAIKDSKPRRVVRSVLADLAGYVELHFSDEEEFMRSSGYPSPLLEAHAREHDDILRRVRKSRKLYESSGQIDSGLASELSEWLQQHEAGEDKQYIDYFRERPPVCDAVSTWQLQER